MEPIFDGLQEFVRVAQTGGFTSAARMLGVTPSAVSKAVRRLETALGVALLHRTSRVVTLTAEGEHLLATAEPVVASIEEVRASFQEHAKGVLGHCRISMPSAFGPLFFGRVAAIAAKEHPGLTLEALVTDRYVDFAVERVDIAIRLGEPPDSRLIARRILTMDYVTAAAPAYLERAGTPATVQELAEHVCVGFRRQSGLVRKWDFHREATSPPIESNSAATDSEPETADAKAETIVPRGPSIDDPSTYRALLIEGVGIGQAPRYLLNRDIAEGRLVEVLPGASRGNIPLTCLFPRPLVRSPKVRAVINTFEHVLKMHIG